MSKYTCLEDYLRGLPSEHREVSLSLDQIDDLLRTAGEGPLPDSARRYRPWWGNETSHAGHVQAEAWQSAGWSVSSVDFDSQTVTFQRLVETGAATVELGKPERAICGFWRRLAALLLDCLILLVFGLLLGVSFFRQLAHMGPWGRLVGFFVALLYFGVLNSSIGNGQTLGKRVFKIRVVDRGGELVSLRKSFLRATFISAFICTNGFSLSTASLLGRAIMSLVAALWIGLIYFYLFNRRTRQALHDIVCGTYVYRADSLHRSMILDTPRLHYLVYAAVLLALFIGGLSVPRSLVMGDLAALNLVYEKVKDVDGVYEAAVNLNHAKYNGQETVSLNTTLFVAQELGSDEETTDRVARIVFEEYPGASDVQQLNVSVSYGYDIGIASQWQNRVVSRSPREWKERLHLSDAH